MAAAPLFCPVRGELTAPALAKDELTPAEEARRIDFLHFLIEDRSYPVDHIAVETVVLKNVGHDGKNSLQADVIVYDVPAKSLAKKPLHERLPHILLVAEIKREAKSKAKGVARQLEPALRQMPNTKTALCPLRGARYACKRRSARWILSIAQQAEGASW